MPLASIIGHGPLIALLRKGVARGRLPQSLLLAGPSGVGKRAVALAIAQAVNCPERAAAGGDDACGTCVTCRRIAQRTHTDVVWLEKGDEASIRIKALRDRVIEVAGYRPFEAARRVFVIEPADAMTVETQDALLKTLEEPAASSVFLLVSAFPDTLLPTIQSRCRRLRFGPLTDAEVARVLVDHGDVEPARARVLAATAAGSVERALAADDEHFDDDREAAMAVLAAAGGRGVPASLKAAAALAQHGTKRRDREALDTRLVLLASLLRDLTHVGVGAGALSNVDLADALRPLASTYGPARATEAFDRVTRARAALKRNASPKIVADWVALGL
ncbi:MAG: DNA polymerase III subunit [Vicinamibacterales bacterium]